MASLPPDLIPVSAALRVVVCPPVQRDPDWVAHIQFVLGIEVFSFPDLHRFHERIGTQSYRKLLAARESTQRCVLRKRGTSQHLDNGQVYLRGTRLNNLWIILLPGLEATRP